MQKFAHPKLPVSVDPEAYTPDKNWMHSADTTIILIITIFGLWPKKADLMFSLTHLYKVQIIAFHIA